MRISSRIGMGCNGSKSVAIIAPQDDADRNGAALKSATSSDGASSTRPVTPQPIPPSMAFEIPFDDQSDDSIVKRHPPLRLQRLEEQQQQSASLTLEDLNEKQQDAENRRQQFLQMRAQSAKRKYAQRNNNSGDADGQEEEEEKVEEVEDGVKEDMEDTNDNRPSSTTQ